MTPAAAKKDKDKDKDKATKKPLKSLRMNNKTKKIVEEKYHDDEKKKGEVEIYAAVCDSLLLNYILTHPIYYINSILVSSALLFEWK